MLVWQSVLRDVWHFSCSLGVLGLEHSAVGGFGGVGRKCHEVSNFCGTSLCATKDMIRNPGSTREGRGMPSSGLLDLAGRFSRPEAVDGGRG